jgi:hypothetical protein
VIVAVPVLVLFVPFSLLLPPLLMNHALVLLVFRAFGVMPVPVLPRRNSNQRDWDPAWLHPDEL